MRYGEREREESGLKSIFIGIERQDPDRTLCLRDVLLGIAWDGRPPSSPVEPIIHEIRPG
jgi:hypothetical protein